MSKKRILLLIIWLIILNLPYIFGYLNQPDDLVFGGFLLNPIDGNSYLAKIQQGYSGSWFFQLPYTSQENSDVFLFVLYNLIGHFSRVFSLSPIFTFHLFRILFSIFLFFSIGEFLNLFYFHKRLIKDSIFTILIFGSGMGWLYLFSGDLPADFWVSEAYPFLSAFTNAHFPLAISLMLWTIIYLFKQVSTKQQLIMLFLVGFILANISPFAAIISGVILIVNFLINKEENRTKSFFKVLFFALGSAPIAIYQYIVIKSDPVLAGWNAQNVTPAPNLINSLFSFSPFIIGLLLLIILNIYQKFISFSKQAILLLCWFVVAILFVYLPLDLQRRFLIGFYIPVTVLFGLFLDQWIKNQTEIFPKNFRIYFPILFIFSILSNMIILSGAIFSIKSNSDKIYIPNEIFISAQWIKENCFPDSVILSGPETGLLLPSYTFSRTAYGHLFETVNSVATRERLLQFWTASNISEEENLINEWKIDYIFYGSEEKELGKPKILDHLKVIYEDASVLIYEVKMDE